MVRPPKKRERAVPDGEGGRTETGKGIAPGSREGKGTVVLKVSSRWNIMIVIMWLEYYDSLLKYSFDEPEH